MRKVIRFSWIMKAQYEAKYFLLNLVILCWPSAFFLWSVRTFQNLTINCHDETYADEKQRISTFQIIENKITVSSQGIEFQTYSWKLRYKSHPCFHTVNCVNTNRKPIPEYCFMQTQDQQEQDQQVDSVH